MTIFAFTEIKYQKSYPGYVNLSERVADPREIVLTVRTSGEQYASSMILGREQLQAFVRGAQAYLDKTK